MICKIQERIPQPAPKETLPVKQTETADEEIMPTEMQTEPAVSEATQPAKATEPVSGETVPVKGAPMVPPETSVYTIGADPGDPANPFPWWIVVAVAAVTVLAGIVFIGTKKK